LANKDIPLIVSLNNDKSVSKPIKIKTAGIKDEFMIIAGNNKDGEGM
jgi:hypothetical protein